MAWCFSTESNPEHVSFRPVLDAFLLLDRSKQDTGDEDDPDALTKKDVTLKVCKRGPSCPISCMKALLFASRPASLLQYAGSGLRSVATPCCQLRFGRTCHPRCKQHMGSCCTGGYKFQDDATRQDDDRDEDDEEAAAMRQEML